MNEARKTSGSLALGGPARVITIPATQEPQNRRLRVAAYARVSSSSEDQKHSFAAQTAHYTELITSHPDWDLVDVYADEGITGTSAERREDFQRLLADCRRGRIDKVLVKSSSRFARNTKECLETVRELKALGVGVCFEEQNIDTSELAGELLTTLFAMMDQRESVVISENIRWSIQTRMANGTFVPSSLPFGYRKDACNKIIIDHPRAKYVREIFSLFLNGWNTREIAAAMQEWQALDPVLDGYQWTFKAVSRILKNEKYAGNSLWQKSFRTTTLPRCSLKNKGQLDQYYLENAHPAIIDSSTYTKVQSLLQIRKAKFFPQTRGGSALQRTLTCGYCGSPFRKVTIHGIAYHVCRRHTENRDSCPNGHIPEEKIEQAFLRLYYKLRHQGLPVLHQLLQNLQEARRGRLLWSRDMVEVNNKIAELTRQERLLAELKQQGLVDPDLFISRRNGLAEQLRAVKLEKERLLADEEDQTLQQTQELLEVLASGPDLLDTFDGELFHELVERIIVESSQRLRFRLINGLELTETIERTAR